MKILTVTNARRSRHDFCQATEGEIAFQPLDLNVETQRCHIGIESLQPSTTVKVRATKLSVAEMVAACTQYADGYAAALIESALSVAAAHAIGTVLSPLFDRAADEWVYITRKPTKPIARCTNCFERPAVKGSTKCDDCGGANHHDDYDDDEGGEDE